MVMTGIVIWVGASGDFVPKFDCVHHLVEYGVDDAVHDNIERSTADAEPRLPVVVFYALDWLELASTLCTPAQGAFLNKQQWW